jgi:hypothetical protein
VRLQAEGVTKRAIVVRHTGRLLLVTCDGLFTPGNGIVGLLLLVQLDDGSYVDRLGRRPVVVEVWDD